MASKRRQVKYRAEAKQDVSHARDAYEKLSAGLGDRFLAAVKDCIEVVHDHPDAFERVDAEVRRSLVTRFPYAVFYELKG